MVVKRKKKVVEIEARGRGGIRRCFEVTEDP